MSGLATVFSILSATFFRSFPDDPYHVARTFAAYQHFASVISILGFIGALREHAFSVAIFATHLLLDTTLASIPRFTLLLLFSSAEDQLCVPGVTAFALQPTSPSAQAADAYRSDEVESTWAQPGWSETECVRVLWLLRAVLLVAALSVTFLQFWAALAVREYAKALFLRKRRKGSRLGRAMPSLEEKDKVENGNRVRR
ncbi:MAG: hypothetical protein M1814_001948 [Vezdaea aestivalis]|nr:MAG: hypothetical protein M1814_001948 [Vezdaea aestivalis]